MNFWIERDGATGASAPPLLMIAGLGYATWCWQALRALLRADAALTMFDNRGTGRSDKPAGPYSIPLLADDAIAVMDQAGLEAAHVLGHSMGGYIAQTLALRHPRRVRSLILVGTSPGGPETHPVPAATMEVWKLAGTMPPAQYARQSMPHSFAPGWTAAHAAEFDAILERRLAFPTPTANWLAQYQACVDFVTNGIDVTGIRVPATVIHGEQDQVVPHHNGKLLSQRLPGARFVSLPDVGHLPMLEVAPRLATLVREHLAAHA